MWWIIGAVVVALIAFVCWIAWELIHAPMVDDVSMVDDVLDDFTFVDDGEELDESEYA